MRFTERMIRERGAVVTLVQQGLLTQVDAGAQLELTDRQVRRLVRRVEQAGGDVQALAYQRRHPAPNRLPAHVRAAVGALAAEHPAWSAAAIWEAVEAQAVTPLPSLRTVSGWLRAERAGARGPRPKPARRFEAPGPLALVQMDTTYGQWLVGPRMAYVIAMLDDYSSSRRSAKSCASQ
jgi:hypothetical protein